MNKSEYLRCGCDTYGAPLGFNPTAGSSVTVPPNPRRRTLAISFTSATPLRVYRDAVANENFIAPVTLAGRPLILTREDFGALPGRQFVLVNTSGFTTNVGVVEAVVDANLDRPRLIGNIATQTVAGGANLTLPPNPLRRSLLFGANSANQTVLVYVDAVADQNFIAAVATASGPLLLRAADLGNIIQRRFVVVNGATTSAVPVVEAVEASDRP